MYIKYYTETIQLNSKLGLIARVATLLLDAFTVIINQRFDFKLNDID